MFSLMPEKEAKGICIDLSGKTALITGAANGIGKALCKVFSSVGARIVAVDIDRKSLQRLSREFEREGRYVLCRQLDISRKKEMDRLWAELEGEEVHVLINNAGIYPFKDFLDLDEALLERVMNLNLYSVIWMCQHFIRKNKGRGGIIVNIGSIEAIMPFKKGLSQYSLSKVGVITLTRDLAREFASRGFRINAVIPGGILTRGTQSAAWKGIRHLEFGLVRDAFHFRQRIPAGRLGKAEEVAHMALVLASDLASYVHGALIPVDGGFLSN